MDKIFVKERPGPKSNSEAINSYVVGEEVVTRFGFKIKCLSVEVNRPINQAYFVVTYVFECENELWLGGNALENDFCLKEGCWIDSIIYKGNWVEAVTPYGKKSDTEFDTEPEPVAPKQYILAPTKWMLRDWFLYLVAAALIGDIILVAIGTLFHLIK